MFIYETSFPSILAFISSYELEALSICLLNFLTWGQASDLNRHGFVKLTLKCL